MKILIITSCTGEKVHTPDNQLTQAEFELLHDKEVFQQKEATLSQFLVKAEDMYTGQQHVRLMGGIRQFGPDNVDLWIVSAGYGVIPGNQQIVPYECTFATMKVKELKSWSEHLQVPQDIRKVLAQKYDLALVLLGDAYLKACQLDDSVVLGSPTIFFCGGAAEAKLPKIHNVHTIVLKAEEAKKYSCALISLKGEVVKRILTELPGNGQIDVGSLLTKWR